MKEKKITKKKEIVNVEQRFFDTLKERQTEDLISRANELFRSTYNMDLEIDMIKNILIYRDVDVTNIPDRLITSGYHRFMPNTELENKKYGLNTK